MLLRIARQPPADGTTNRLEVAECRSDPEPRQRRLRRVLAVAGAIRRRNSVCVCWQVGCPGKRTGYSLGGARGRCVAESALASHVLRRWSDEGWNRAYD